MSMFKPKEISEIICMTLSIMIIVGFLTGVGILIFASLSLSLLGLKIIAGAIVLTIISAIYACFVSKGDFNPC